MLKRYRTKWKFKELTNGEIFAAIRYLESEASNERRCDSSTFIILIYLSLMLLLSFAALTCLYYRLF
jgi:hypothetical protein